MPPLETFQSNAAEAPLMRKWLFRALILSLLLHGGLFYFFQQKKLENFAAPGTERLAKPLRVFKQVAIPEIPKDPEELRVKLDKMPKVERITVPTEKPQLEELRVAPQVPDLTQAMVMDKPKADAGTSDVLAKVEAQSRGAMEKELNSLAGQILKDSPKAPRQPAIILPKATRAGAGGAGDAEGIPGLKSLDDALAATGPLPAGDKPIGMPGGALYEYGSAALKPDAIEELRKLGELIRRNPKATFSIEGHTDSFGSVESNQQLSEDRAAAVRDWLILQMGIAPTRVQTRGFGSSRLIVPPRPIGLTPGAEQAEILRQQPNRRVEIVIKTNRT
jgi:outer membrane protein OmpA-like peptidoglycan-associated protein